MTDRFDPNIPPAGPTDPCIEGEFTGVVAITEQPTLGKSNLVINRGKSFEIHVDWHVFGNLVPLWLTALKVDSPNWVVTAYAESQGPGDEISLGSVLVPVGQRLHAGRRLLGHADGPPQHPPRRGSRRPDAVRHVQDRGDRVPELGPRPRRLRHDGLRRRPRREGREPALSLVQQ